MSAENREIKFLDALPKDLEAKRERGHIEHEESKGIVCNFKKIFITIEDEIHGVVGVLEAYTAFAEIYIEDLWVDAKHRKRGYGTRLIRALEEHFQGRGYNNINLVTSDFAAPEFYKKCGFKVEFVRANKYNPQLEKTFFIKPFGDQVQTQGVLEQSTSSGSESIIYTEEPLTKVLKERIYQGFAQHAVQTVGNDGEMVDYAFVARQKNEIIGVVVFKTFWGALHIKYLWVSDNYRGLGIGKKLMEHALKKGRNLGCPFAFVETMSFQAVDFYKKLGFEENFVRHGYAHGTSFYYLQKNL